MSDRSRSGQRMASKRGKAALKIARSAVLKKPVAKKAAAKKPALKKALPLKIDLIIDAPAWLTALKLEEAVLARRLRVAARRALGVARADRWKGSSRGLECCLVLSSDAKVKRLNRDYRGKDKPTNVLSFAALDGGLPPKTEIWPLGDVILALGVCRQEAKAQGKSLEQHLMHLTIHGVLHLLGYDHEVNAEAEHMEGLEISALKRLGIGNPYLTM